MLRRQLNVNVTLYVTSSGLPPKRNRLFLGGLFTEFCENRLRNFSIILLTNSLTNADENITSLAEVTTLACDVVAEADSRGRDDGEIDRFSERPFLEVVEYGSRQDAEHGDEYGGVDEDAEDVTTDPATGRRLVAVVRSM